MMPLNAGESLPKVAPANTRFGASFLAVLIGLAGECGLVAQNWTLTASSAPQLAWQAMASSAEGAKVAAVATDGSSGAIYTSTDWARTCRSNAVPSQSCYSLAPSPHR